jgi:hypothetical protein
MKTSHTDNLTEAHSTSFNPTTMKGSILPTTLKERDSPEIMATQME